MNNFNWLWSYPMIFLVVLALVGYVITVLFTFLSPYLLWSTWKQVVKPPPNAVEVVAYDGVTMIIRAEDDVLYACDLDLDRCMETAEPFQLRTIPNNFSCPAIAPATPIFVDNIVSTSARRFCGYHGDYVDVSIVVLDDGAVWIGSHYVHYRENGVHDIFVMYGMGCIGAVTGVILGVLVITGSWMAAHR